MTTKESQARNLFFQTELSKTRIAELVGIPRRTLHYWIRERNWDRQKTCAAHMPAMLAENVYHLLARLTQQLMAEDRIARPITRHEADTLHKLTLTVNKLKNRSTLNESMEMFGLFMDDVHSKNPEFAKQLMPFVDNFIGSRADLNLAQFRYIPPALEDVTETQQDIADIMAWTEGPASVPEAEELAPQSEEHSDGMPTSNDPAVLQADPAISRNNPAVLQADPAISRSNPAILQADPAIFGSGPAEESTADLLAEMDRLMAQLSPETREHLLSLTETTMPLTQKEAA